MQKKIVVSLILFWVLSFNLIGCEGCGTSSQLATPEGTVTAVVKNLQEGKPGIIWDALPASYQKDLNGLVKEFATKMDAELWDKGFVIAKKFTDVARSKKDFILANPMTAGLAELGVSKEDLGKNWGPVVSILNIVVNSELAKLDNLKSFDGGKFLSGTGEDLMKWGIELESLSPEKPFEKLKGIKVEVVKTENEKATLKVTVPGEEPEEMEMVKVEGRWIPADMAKEWADMIKEAKEGLTELSGEELTKNKPQVLAAMAAFESVLDQLAQAKTQQEFDQTIEGLAGGGLF